MRWQRLESLEKLGWAVGRNLAIEYRLGANDLEQPRSAVAQILRLTPDVILADGGPALTAAQQAARTMPIVFTGMSESVERGLCREPGSSGRQHHRLHEFENDHGREMVELLKEIALRVTRVATLFNPASTFALAFVRSAETASQKFSIIGHGST
jgi:putative ABC transport system substrate-binding protein